MASPTPPYTLYAYTPSPSSHTDLPLLDPASLYAACLLLNAAIPFSIAAPNTWFHTTLPRLEHNASGSSGAIVAEGVAEIDMFVRARQPLLEHTPFKPLEAHISTHLEPLIYSVFFPLPTIPDGSAVPLSSQIFNRITFSTYSAGLPFPANRTVPHRLREKINERLRGSSSALYQALHSEGDDVPEDEFSSSREGSKPQMKSLSKDRPSKWISFKTARKGFQEEFVRAKTQAVARETLEPINSFISAHQDTALPEDGPIPHATLHLFALLAPLILYSDQSILSTHPIAQVLSTPDFAPLKSLVESISNRLLSSHRARLPSEPQRWEKIILGDAAVSDDDDAWASTRVDAVEKSPSTNASSWTSYLSSFFSGPKSKRPHVQKEEEHLTPTQRQAIKRLKTRRTVFIVGSLLGTAAWLTYLFTNVITIQVRTVDDEEEKEEEDEEEESEEEDGDDWTIVTDEDDEEDDEDEEMDVDVDEIFVDDE